MGTITSDTKTCCIKGVRTTQGLVGLRRLRIERDMTQKELAGKAGLLQQTVSDYEKNRRIPTLHNACRLAKALETTVEVLCEALDEQRQRPMA